MRGPLQGQELLLRKARAFQKGVLKVGKALFHLTLLSVLRIRASLSTYSTWLALDVDADADAFLRRVALDRNKSDGRVCHPHKDIRISEGVNQFLRGKRHTLA